MEYEDTKITNNNRWKYCTVGNIVKTRIDEDGVVRYGTKQYSGGTKVYLCGKYWDETCNKIDVIGLTRFKRFKVEFIDTKLIENIRIQRTYKETILRIMNDYEFQDC